MNKIVSRSKRITLSILSFLFMVEEVGLFAAAAIISFQNDISNEFGQRFLLSFAFAALGFSNLLAFSITYFYLRKWLEMESNSALLGALIPANVAPLITIVCVSRYPDGALLSFFLAYVIVFVITPLVRYR
jgi:hypothetical protein